MPQKKVDYKNCTRTMETIEISIRRFTVNGRPTCFSWFGSDDHPAEVCRFYGSRNFGCKPVCLALAEDIHHYEEDECGASLCRPVEECPVWHGKE